MPRKTDSSNPADWVFIAATELAAVQLLARQQIAYTMCRSKLAEVLEKIMKAELIRTGWFLERTHDLLHLAQELERRDPQLGSLTKAPALALTGAYFSSRYPGFDLEDADWPSLQDLLDRVAVILSQVEERVGGTP